MNKTQLINETFQYLGITKCYKGYRQLMISVELALDDELRLLSVTEEIYEQTAKICKCNSSNIEKNIRTVIDHIWDNNSQRLIEIAGYPLEKSPSVSELIAILVTYLERNNEDI